MARKHLCVWLPFQFSCNYFAVSCMGEGFSCIFFRFSEVSNSISCDICGHGFCGPQWSWRGSCNSLLSQTTHTTTDPSIWVEVSKLKVDLLFGKLHSGSEQKVFSWLCLVKTWVWLKCNSRERPHHCRSTIRTSTTNRTLWNSKENALDFFMLTLCTMDSVW